MKKLILLIFLPVILLQTVSARTIEIDIYGMTCGFCVDSLERKFGKMHSVTKVDVSLKLKKVRLETKANHPSIEAIKKAILDAGFTPVKVTILANEKN
jgi:copper chaperone CopZ